MSNALERDTRLLGDRLGFHLQLNSQEDSVQVGIRDPQLAFVGLAGPKARGGRLLDDLRRNPEMHGHLPDLGLVQVADREEVRPGIAELRRVSGQDLALVPGPHDDAVLRVRAVVEDRHPRAGSEIAPRDRIRLGSLKAFLEGRRDRPDVHDLELDAGRLREPLGVLEILPALPVRQGEGEDPLRTDRVRAKLRDQRRVDAAAQAEDDAFAPALSDRVDDERLDDENMLLLVPRDEVHGRPSELAHPA